MDIKVRVGGMTEQEILDFYQKLVDFYGDSLANFEHEPRRFMMQIKLYRYYKGLL